MTWVWQCSYLQHSLLTIVKNCPTIGSEVMGRNVVFTYFASMLNKQQQDMLGLDSIGH